MTSPCLYPTGRHLTEMLAWESEDLSDGVLPDDPWSACDIPRTSNAFLSLTVAGKGPPFADWPDHFETQKLVTWGIFNPFGPTVSWLGLVPIPEEGLLLLVHRMRNPFLSETTVFGSLDADPWPSPDLLRQLVTEIFAQNGTRENRLVRSLPTYVALGEDESVDARLAGTLFRLAYQRENEWGGNPGSVSDGCRELLQHHERPWDYATEQFRDILAVFDRLEEETGRTFNDLMSDENLDLDELLDTPSGPKPDDESLFGLWISLATDDAHISATEAALHEAWLNSQLTVGSFPIVELEPDSSGAPQAFPHTADDYSWLGCVFFDLGQFEEAAAFEQMAVVLDPENAARRFAHGRSLYQGSEWHHASEEFRRATELEPEVAEYWGGYSVALLYSGREAEGRRAYAKAVSLKPALEDSADMRGAWDYVATEEVLKEG